MKRTTRDTPAAWGSRASLGGTRRRADCCDRDIETAGSAAKRSIAPVPHASADRNLPHAPTGHPDSGSGNEHADADCHPFGHPDRHADAEHNADSRADVDRTSADYDGYAYFDADGHSDRNSSVHAGPGFAAAPSESDPPADMAGLPAMSVVRVTDLGRMDYASAWAVQRRLVENLKAGDGPDRLLLVEHDDVLTLGRRSRPEHVLMPLASLEAMGVKTFEVERGGDVTYHGPGQLVAYPIFDLKRHRPDVRWFSRSLLKAAADTVRAFGINAEIREGLETGVWVPNTSGSALKIAALGVRVERWVTYHGVALNVDPDLSRYEMIVPCGLEGVMTTSMSVESGSTLTLQDVMPVFLEAFADSFGVALELESGSGRAEADTRAGGINGR